MASSPYASTPDTTNASRASRLLLGPCTDGLRDVLRHYVPPQTFSHVIKQNKSSLPKLSSPQKNLILPQHGNYNGNYCDMDISLLYILLRNICNIPHHSNGWGFDPDTNDKTISANIERIRLARNQIGHSLGTSLSHADFNQIWSTVRAAMVDLDTILHNGNKYEKDIDFLRHETMDPERDQHYQDELRKQFLADQETRDMVADLRKDVMEIKKSSIPPNVREQYRIKLQEWRNGDRLYYETHNFPSMIDKVRNKPFVTFVGVPGSGKSATAHHIALKLHDEGYEVVPIKDIRKIEDYCDPQNPQVFVIDDVVGVFGLQKIKLNVLADYKQNITTPCMTKSRTLMTCREVVFNEVLSYKPFFTDELSVVKLHSSENALNDNDKKEILKKYGLDDQKYDLDVDLLLPSLPASTSCMFPLFCKLFSKDKRFQELGRKFFKIPVQCIIYEFDSMQIENKVHYATLVLCAMKENCLSRDDLNDEDFAKRKRDVLEKCELESQTDTFKFGHALLAMEGTYTKQNADGQYSFIHDSMYEICAYHFGKQFPDQILKYMSIIYIANFVKPQAKETKMAENQTFIHLRDESSNANELRSREEDKDTESKENDNVNNNSEDSFDLSIMLREDQYPLLAQRLYKEIEGMELYDVFSIAALKHPQVCKAFIAELKTKSYAELKSLFLHQKKDVDKIMSKRESILEESEDMDQWSKEREIQRLFVADRVISNDITPYVRVISWVIYYGHHEILKFIVEQTQQHQEEGELFMNTRNSRDKHTRNKGIKISNVKHAGSYDQCIGINSEMEQIRLLLLSCFSDDVETLEIILSHTSLSLIDEIYHDDAYNTDILSYKSPLTVACRRGHAVMAHKLLKAGADINMEDRNGDTPLVAACYEGHMCVVRELVKEKVSLNLQDGHGDTALVTACREGHESVVEFLLQAGADIRKGDRSGYTPLVITCRKGHVGVVKFLLGETKADITELNSICCAPLIIACFYGRVSVVAELIKSMANVNIQDGKGNTPLITACLRGHLDIIELLMKADADIRESGNYGYTPLTAACSNGHFSVVQLLVNEGVDISESDRNGHTPLITACSKGHLSVARLLVKEGVNIDESDKNGQTPLVTACFQGHFSVVDELLKARANVNFQNGKGNTPLVTACCEGHVGVVELLLKAGADIGESDDNGYTPLITACRGGFVGVVESLLKAGADIRERDNKGTTPLIAACYKGHVDVVESLLNEGAGTGESDGNGYKPLVAACREGHVSVAELLMKAGVDIRERDHKGITPLVAACREGHVGVVELLLKKGADIKQSDSHGYTPLVTACYKGHVSVVKLLIKAGIDIRERDKNGYTALVSACFIGHCSVVDELLKVGDNVNIGDGKGNTPLVTACREGHVDVVESLLKAGADIGESDKYGYTPLVTACYEGHVDVVELLMEAGADIREIDKNGKAPLLTACNEGHVEIVELLIKAGVDINKGNKNGYTPLIAACIGKHVRVVDKLVELGADVNLQPEYGRTPLGYASFKGNVNMVEILLKYGVHINQRDSKGKTAMDIAYENGNQWVIEELEKALDSCQTKK